MVDKPDDFYGVFSLTGAAIILAVFAVAMWVVPLFPTYDSYWHDRATTKMFSGLTDFGEDAYRRRMPAFIVAAFSAIFLLQLRRR